jgi:taurine--2-oxoglutarate transaminase
VLLGVEGGKHYGLVVGARGVEIDGGGGLGAEVAVTEVEVESADAVGAAGAGELHASLDAGDGVMSIHNSSEEMAALGRFFREQGLYRFVRWNTFFTDPPLCINEQQMREAFAIIDRRLLITDKAVSD